MINPTVLARLINHSIKTRNFKKRQRVDQRRLEKPTRWRFELVWELLRRSQNVAIQKDRSLLAICGLWSVDSLRQRIDNCEPMR